MIPFDGGAPIYFLALDTVPLTFGRSSCFSILYVVRVGPIGQHLRMPRRYFVFEKCSGFSSSLGSTCEVPSAVLTRLPSKTRRRTRLSVAKCSVSSSSLSSRALRAKLLLIGTYIYVQATYRCEVRAGCAAAAERDTQTNGREQHPSSHLAQNSLTSKDAGSQCTSWAKISLHCDVTKPYIDE